VSDAADALPLTVDCDAVGEASGVLVKLAGVVCMGMVELVEAADVRV
jgi:hypothetical protein